MIYSWFKWGESKILKLTRPQHAYLYFKNYRINLLNGFSEDIGIEIFLKNLESLYVQDFFKAPRVFHFYYELGLLMQDLAYAVGEDSPLVIDLSYEQFKFGPIPKSKLTNLPLKSIQRPTWSEYRDIFHRIQEQLLMGNCYQLNLTFPYEFETSEFFNDQEVLKTFFSLKDLSAYAHATYLGDELLLSNSPECLFSYGHNKLFSMPIKGTKKRQGEWKKIWKEMLSDQKEEGELNMITDLLRNDLNKLDLPVAKVLKKRTPLLVPGLLHQCSILSVALTKKISLAKIIQELFPGGSVTGAPKKRVMQLIHEFEQAPRGAYCGSTLLCFKHKKVASINIRTCTVSLAEKLYRYGAGGGITLLSQASHEFLEMEEKVKSFLTLIKAPGYHRD